MAKKLEKPAFEGAEKIRKLAQYSKMKATLYPLIENLKDETSVQYLFVKENNESLIASLEHALETCSLFSELLKSLFASISNPKIISLSHLYCYLAMVESVGLTLIDDVLLLLIAEGHDLHIERRFVRHVASFEDLTKIDLWTKLEFLEEHNLKPICKIFDRTLRNQIAHLDFAINADGTIRTRKGVKIDINKQINLLLTNIQVLVLTFVDLGFEKILGRMAEA